MSLQGSIARQNKKEPAAAPIVPTVTAANNGTSLSGTTVQLGQAIAAVGDPAILINNREIPMGGFSFALRDGADRKFLIDNLADHYAFGDIDNNTTGLRLELTASNETAQIRSALYQFFIAGIDTLGMQPGVSIGLPGGGNGFRLSLNEDQITGNGVIICENNLNNRLIDGVTGSYINIGGIGSADNGNGVFIDDSAETVRARIGDRSGFLNNNGTDWYLDLDPAGRFKIGDINNVFGLTTFLDIDAVTGTISSSIIDGLGSTGQFFTSNNGSFFNQDDGTFAYSARTQSNNASLVSVEALNGRAQVNAMHDGTNPFARMFAEDQAPVTDFLSLNVYRDQVNVIGAVAGVTATLLNLDAGAGLYEIGDINTVSTGTRLKLDAAGSTIENRFIVSFTAMNPAGTDKYLKLDPLNLVYTIGLDAGAATDTHIVIDDNSKTIKTKGTQLLIGSLTTLADGAGASLGTLTNSPSAGDPTKWLQIDDNGTTRHIPAW